ncbi:hypothetical protein ABZ840_20025 [Streptomyces sp. NPDC047117]|uniref:hypothetical protein n=1 Tax=Streptomyces sp. NPDC047117 TaxID=3155379 RepID=UPI0033F8856E
MTHHKRSRFFARASVFWYRLFGGIEVILGVMLPLLFVYPQTQNEVGLQATVSVSIAVIAALGTFWGWRDRWGTYRAQDILIAETLGDWELTLIGLIGDSDRIPDAREQALAKTKEAVAALFAVLGQEHEANFAGVQSPSDIVVAMNRQDRYRNIQ